jgi:carboxypeptidase PM20D1
MDYFIAIIMTLIALVFDLLLIALINAIRIKAEYLQGKEYDEDINAELPQKYAKDLSEMIKVRTVSERGKDYSESINEFHKCLEKLYPNIHKNLEKINIDGALLFKWKGNNSDKNPILLMSHMDVVEASGNWRYPPFSGTISDGKIWGRGTVDTKGALCAILEAVEKLTGEGFIPECDVYIASSNNEEITGDGAIKTVDYLDKQGIKLDLVMDEGGAVMGGMLGSEASCAMIGVLEKGRANVKFIAHSIGGHASIPFKNNPFARLARLIDTIERKPIFKKKLTKPVKTMYRAMVPYMSFKYRFFLGNLWLFSPILPFILGKMGGQANALISSTCVFTQAEGSHGANVIPETATVTANMRFMVHEPLEATFKKVSKIAKKNDIWMEMISGYDVCKAANVKTYAYKQVVKQVKETFGEIPVVPYVMLAGTDARHYTKICDCVLRFVPLTLSDAQQKSAHAIDENINISSLSRAVSFYVDFIKGYGK